MYDEEEISRWEQEGGAFLIREGVVNTDDIEEVREFKRKIEEEEEEEIEKIDSEEDFKSFDIIKTKERKDDEMDYIYDDSGYNEEKELEELIGDFLDGDIDQEELKKAKEKMPKKLVEGLKEAFKILNAHKDYLDEDLKNAMQYISRILTHYPEPGPGKYPYPVKKKAIDFPDLMEQMFGGNDDEDDEFEKSEPPTKETPWPSFDTAIKKQARQIEKIEDSMFDPYDRLA